MLIKKSKLRQIIREELSRSISEDISQLYKKAMSKDRIPTSKVDFEWGTYDSSKYSNEPYFVRPGGELGDIQFKGDPFTYAKDPKDSRKRIVVSAPESKKELIGRSFKKDDRSKEEEGEEEEEEETPEENPCAKLKGWEIVDRLKHLTLGELFKYHYQPPHTSYNGIFAKTPRGRRPGFFASDALNVGRTKEDPVGWHARDKEGNPIRAWSTQTLGTLLSLEDVIIEKYGQGFWMDLLIGDSHSIHLDEIIDAIRNGRVECPPKR